jgi:glutaredoxin
MGKKVTPKKKAATPTSPLLGNKGLIAGLVVIALIVSTVGYFFATSGGGVSVVPPQECGANAISYMNKNIAQANATATLVSVTEKNGVYQIAARYQERNISIYATKDCSLLFTSSYTMKGTATTTPTVSPTPTVPPEPVKSSRPATELFVMSFCPFGVQAENVMKPVVDLLGTKANITVRYIATVQGTTVDSVKSLHGLTEAKEDLRQLCIAKYYPAKLWPYLVDIDANCYPIRQNVTSLDACSVNATLKLGIDNQKIETCASGSEGLALLKADEAITGNYKVTGSPTLLINGQKYTGQRTPDAYKQGICDHFVTPPAECSVNLSAQAAAASGSCG